MIRYVLKRLVMMIPVLLGVSFLIFTMLYFSPGDPAVQILGEGASEEAIQELREELGLNDPFFVRYFDYLKDMILSGSTSLSSMPYFLYFSSFASTTARRDSRTSPTACRNSGSEAFFFLTSAKTSST